MSQTLPQQQKRKQQQEADYQRVDWAQESKDSQRIINTKIKKYQNEKERIRIYVQSAKYMQNKE